MQTFVALLLVLPALLSALLLMAHFFRAGNLLGVAAALMILALLIVPHRWARRMVQIMLLLGSVEWVRTTIEFVQIRQARGAPSTRLMVILGSVAAFTVVSALLLSARPVRRRFGG